MTKTTKFTLGAAALFLLFLVFGSSNKIDKLLYAGLAVFALVVFYRVKASYLLEESLRLSLETLDDLIKKNNFTPEYKHSFSKEGLVSGVAIRKDDPRIFLLSGNLPAKLFDRDAVLSIKRLKTGEKYDETWESDNSFKSTAALQRVEVFVKDLDTPSYKLYFEDGDLTRQWESRLTAWLDMHV